MFPSLYNDCSDEPEHGGVFGACTSKDPTTTGAAHPGAVAWPSGTVARHDTRSRANVERRCVMDAGLLESAALMRQQHCRLRL